MLIPLVKHPNLSPKVWSMVGTLWDHFNRSLDRDRCNKTAASEDHDQAFHRRIAHDAHISLSQLDFVVLIHRECRHLLMTPHPIPATRATDEPHGYVNHPFQELPNFPYIERAGTREEIRRLQALDTFMVPTGPLSLEEGAVRLEALLRTKQNRGEVRATDPRSISMLATCLFPQKEGFSKPYRCAVQLIVAKKMYRTQHGSLDPLIGPMGGPLPSFDQYLEAIMSRLGIDKLVFFEAIGISWDSVRGISRTGLFFPVKRLETILNALELADAAVLTYILYQREIDPYFQVIRRKGKLSLRLSKAIRPMEDLRRYGFGGLSQAHRVSRGLTVKSTLKQPDFPIAATGMAALRRVEKNETLPWSMKVTRGIIDFFEMGAEGLLAAIPDLPRLIPIQAPTGGLIDVPQKQKYHLTGYTPVVRPSEQGIWIESAKRPHPEGLGRRLVFERILRGWSLLRFSEITGYDVDTLSDTEGDRRRPTLPLLQCLAHERGFNIPLEELADLANKTPYHGTVPPRWETLRARRPILVQTTYASSGRVGDLGKIDLYLRHEGNPGPSQGELLFFLRKDLGRLKADPQLALTVEEMAAQLSIPAGCHSVSDLELNRRPLNPEELERYTALFPKVPRDVFAEAVRRTFGVYQAVKMLRGQKKSKKIRNHFSG